MFVLPAVVVAFLIIFPTLFILYGFMFDKDTGVDVTPVPTGLAVVQACVVGLIIPLLSAILPI